MGPDVEVINYETNKEHINEDLMINIYDDNTIYEYVVQRYDCKDKTWTDMYSKEIKNNPEEITEWLNKYRDLIKNQENSFSNSQQYRIVLRTINIVFQLKQ